MISCASVCAAPYTLDLHLFMSNEHQSKSTFEPKFWTASASVFRILEFTNTGLIKLAALICSKHKPVNKPVNARNYVKLPNSNM